MSINKPHLVVEDFDVIPGRTGGNGGRSSEVLESLRNLPKQKNLKITVTPRDGEDFNKAVGRYSASIHRANALPYRPTIRSFPDEGVIRVYRDPGSDFARNEKGEIILSNEKNARGHFRPLTEAEVAAANK